MVKGNQSINKSLAKDVENGHIVQEFSIKSFFIFALPYGSICFDLCSVNRHFPCTKHAKFFTDGDNLGENIFD